MKTAIVINGKETSIILTGETDIEKQILRDFDGAKVVLLSQDHNILQNPVGGGLMLKKQDPAQQPKKKKQLTKIVPTMTPTSGEEMDV